MPQMAPLNWLNLFISMLMIMLTIKILVYFNFSTKIYKEKNKNIFMNNWKW
uniref:ATP synthase complex subunit 8 n=1 Tax=Hypocassida meridionalis TaxID=1425619 RepID=A0A3G1GN72_9CUCU|nr:ATP synthase F0 subunit 8 [Hypocassida meridionalis]